MESETQKKSSLPEDEKYMRRAIQLARCGEAGAAPNPMVGAVVVCKGRIIGEGYHRRCGGPHAEVNAINSVRESDRELLRESTIYVSLEPCAHWGKTPPCADLIIEKRIPRVVIGCQDPFAKVNGLGIRKLRDAGIEVVVGVLEKESMELNRRFMTFHSRKRPYITLKWAQTADGYISGMKDGQPCPLHISNPMAQTLVHRLRSRCQGIMVGTGTVLCDNPSLTTRLWDGPSPLRITVDRHHVLTDELRIFDGEAGTMVYHDETLPEILSDLHSKGIQHLLVEGGARLLSGFLSGSLWDEIRMEQSPLIAGDGVKAPEVPQEAVVEQSCIFGGSKILILLNAGA